MMSLDHRLLASCLMLLAGCGEMQRASLSLPAGPRMVAPAASEAADFAGETPAIGTEATPGQDLAARAAVTQRTIIYTATIDLIVEDFSRVETEVPRLVASFGGYISQQDISGSTGTQRRGSWTARVPVDRFEGFLEAIAQLGEPERVRRDSRDVSEQFFDTEARLKNKKVEESRLLTLLEEKTGKLEDILQVERELSRVRGEIEQLEGSLRLLTDLTSLTTVTINVTELRDYVPPEAPRFGTTVSRTFQDSLQLLVDFGKAIVLFAVALAPWIPLLLGLGLLLTWLVRKATRPRSRPPQAPPSEAFVQPE